MKPEKHPMEMEEAEGAELTVTLEIELFKIQEPSLTSHMCVSLTLYVDDYRNHR